MKQKVGIIGKGNVGAALQSGLDRAGYETRTGGRGSASEIAAWGEIIVLAVPYSAAAGVLKEAAAALKGKVVVDVTNALTKDFRPALGPDTSAAEELQKVAPEVNIVKCFNTMFASTMSTGKAKGQQISAFVASDDEKAREAVAGLARDIGFDAVDAGSLMTSRWIEALGFFDIVLGYNQKLGTDIGFKLVR